ncbi:hypothetical protein QYE76_071020 [Lolium multiflorum]|uniref:DUF3615 domain-containing protein n=1 Tax=Lolium multiflorum TaxID=4521 RepID=A0AAD8SIZ3_LOLMU|nr:hypothetical protein QYE76_071020 [Lolium multiflorum]
MQRNIIDEYGKGYVHFNFTVKSLDGTVHLFFAEVHPDCREVEDVYHCTALNTIDSGHCIGCKDRRSNLHHPNDGGYLGGHKDVGFPFMEYDDSDSAGEDEWPTMIGLSEGDK